MGVMCYNRDIPVLFSLYYVIIVLWLCYYGGNVFFGYVLCVCDCVMFVLLLWYMVAMWYYRVRHVSSLCCYVIIVWLLCYRCGNLVYSCLICVLPSWHSAISVLLLFLLWWPCCICVMPCYVLLWYCCDIVVLLRWQCVIPVLL